MPNEITALPVKEVSYLAEQFAASGFFGFKKPEEAFALMMIAQAQGLHPVTAAEQYTIIQGRPALKATAIQERFQNAGGRIAWKERTDTKCVLWLSHPAGGELTVTWDMARAEKAGLSGKDTWKKYPAQMLSARCISEGVRALFPACLGGMYVEEEVKDFDDEDKPSRGRKAPARPAPEPAPAPAQEPPKASPKKAQQVVYAEVVKPSETPAQPAPAPSKAEAPAPANAAPRRSFVDVMNEERARIGDEAFTECLLQVVGEAPVPNLEEVPMNLRGLLYKKAREFPDV